MNKRGVRALYITGALVVAVICLSFGVTLLTNGEYLPSGVRDFFVTVGILPPNVEIEINDYGVSCGTSNSKFAVLIKNTGSKPLSGFVARVNSENGQQELSKDQELLSNRETWVDFYGLDCSKGNFVDAVVTPKILVEGVSVEWNESSTNTTKTVKGGGGGGGGGSTPSDPVDPGYTWLDGRPSCSYNCPTGPTTTTSYIYSMPEVGEADYGHNDFAFFQDHNDVFHVVAIKSKVCTSSADCGGASCSGGYCAATSTESENSFVHYTSNDMANWQRQEDLIQTSSNLNDPDSQSVWAPHVIYENGVYYMFYTGDQANAQGGDTQRIMLATNDGTDLNNPANWVKQGVMVDCNETWTRWSFAQAKGCRDPMVYKYNSTTWIMYVTTGLNPSGAVIGYGFSEDLISWNSGNGGLESYVPGTFTTSATGAEGPFLFEEGDKYYLYSTSAGVLYADEIIINTTQILGSTMTSYGNPLEFLHVNLDVFSDLIDNLLVVALRAKPNDGDRHIEFRVIEQTTTGSLTEEYNYERCAVCNPAPNILLNGQSCGYSDDCSGSYCSDFSTINPLYPAESLCCDTNNPTNPEDYCCWDTTSPLTHPVCSDVCGTPSSGNYNLCDERDFKCECDVDCAIGMTNVCDTGVPGICSIGSQSCQSDLTWGTCTQTIQGTGTEQVCAPGDTTDTDCDGLGGCADSDCAANPACNPSACTLTNAYWGIGQGNDNTVQGGSAFLRVTGTNCDGLSVRFNLQEYNVLGGTTEDIIPLNLPANAVFTSGMATSTWTTEWMNDPDGEGGNNNPEYKFVAIMVGDQTKTRTSFDYLTVTQT